MTQRWRVVLAAVCAALLSACAGLPHHPDLPPTVAIALEEAALTQLGKIALASLPSNGPLSDSGFHLLPVGPSALDARLELMDRAEKTIDAQYYLVQKDGAGLAFPGAGPWQLCAVRDGGGGRAARPARRARAGLV